MRALLLALSSNEADLESLLHGVWIATHPEDFLMYRGDESESVAIVRRRRPNAAERKPRNTADTPEIAEVLAGVCMARE